MRTFKITFQDENDNELWTSVCDRHDVDEATRYAHLILATTNWNDAVKFEVTDMQGDRLEYLRQELRAERISIGELVELQSLAKYIDKDDLELLEASGIKESKTK